MATGQAAAALASAPAPPVDDGSDPLKQWERWAVKYVVWYALSRGVEG